MSMQPLPTNSAIRTTNILLAVIAIALLGNLVRLGSLPPSYAGSARVVTTADNTNAPGRYELQRVNDNNVILVDTQTGKVWRRFIETNGGPTDWLGSDPKQYPTESGEAAVSSDGAVITN